MPALGLLLVGGLLAASAAPGAAQEPSPDITWHLTAQVGTPASFSGHALGGVEAVVLRGRWGGAGTIQSGSGNDYGSLLLGAGPAAHLGSTRSLQLRGWAGPAWYRETLDTGPRRSTVVAAATVGLRRPVSRGAVSLQVTWLGGRHTGEDFAGAAPVSGFRLMLGVGR